MPGVTLRRGAAEPGGVVGSVGDGVGVGELPPPSASAVQVSSVRSVYASAWAAKVPTLYEVPAVSVPAGMVRNGTSSRTTQAATMRLP